LGQYWEWYASSLNPWHEGNESTNMISETCLINKTKRHWLFGADGTGNICVKENIENLWTKHKKRVFLVTADGGVDASLNPNGQESDGAQLHFCEMVAALGLLRENGTFILKVCIFTYKQFV
jgi:cap2 methyltransferase